MKKQIYITSFAGFTVSSKDKMLHDSIVGNIKSISIDLMSLNPEKFNNINVAEYSCAVALSKKGFSDSITFKKD